MDKWDASSFKVDEEALEGRVCYGGLDRAIRCGNNAGASIYDSTGILFI